MSKIKDRNLDDKIADICLDLKISNKPIYMQAVPEIKQAFIDDGWYHSPLIDYQMKRIQDGELMTGQEWYDKFEKEFPGDHILPELIDFRNQVMKAAKKAGGIES